MNNLLKVQNVITLLFVGLFSLTLLGCAEMDGKPSVDKSLYQRLGGYDAIVAVVDDFFGKMGQDEQMKGFFEGISKEHFKRTSQLTVDFICQAAGGPCYYSGRSMKTTHKGMGISESDWNRAAALLTETLDKFNVPAREKQEVLAMVTGLKTDIVEK